MKTTFFALIAACFLMSTVSFAEDTNATQPTLNSDKADPTRGAADMPADKVAAPAKTHKAKSHAKKNWKHQMNQDPSHKTDSSAGE